MALFPVLTADGDTILTSDSPSGFAVVVQGSAAPPSAGGGVLVLSDLRDAVQGDAVVLNPLTGAVTSTIATPSILPYAGEGASLSDGLMAVGVEDNSVHAKVVSLNIYDSNTAYSLVASVTSIANANWKAKGGIAGTGTNFYALVWHGSTTTVLWQVSEAGVVGSSWTLPINAQTSAVAVNAAETIAYYTFSSGVALYAWDLVNNVALPNVVAADATFRYLFVDSDGDILLLANAATPWQVRRYTPAGVLLWSVSIGADADTFDDPQMAYLAAADPTTVTVRTFPDATGHTSNWLVLNISDGSTATTFTTTDLEGGGDVPTTCPVLLLPGVTSMGTTFPIRRLRRWAP